MFEEEDRRIFGLAIPDVSIEVVTWRLAASAESPEVEPSLIAGGEVPDGGPVVGRPVVFERGSLPVDTPVYRRDLLVPGTRFDGPAIVEERETTSVIRPGWSVEVVHDGSLIATRESA